MKKIFSWMLVLLVCLSFPMTAAYAAPDGNAAVRSSDALLVRDGANLLTDAEESALRTRLAALSDQYGAQVCVATVSSVEGKDMDVFVENLYDHDGYGLGEDKAGVLLLVSMNPRQYRILSNGFAAQAIPMDAIDAISEAIVPSLSGGNYAAAFNAYADKCAYYLDGHINGFPFDSGKYLMIALAVGALSGVVTAFVLKGQLKSVRPQNRANSYVKQGSMKLTQSEDHFMYRTVTKKERPKEDSSSGSDSGSSRNVGGGSF